MRFLDDPKLYTDYEYFCKHFQWSNNNPRRDTLVYHCYWTGIANALHLLSIKSLLVSQSPPYEIWVWMPPTDLKANRAFVNSLTDAYCVKFLPYSVRRETQSTPFKDCHRVINGGRQAGAAAKSDGLRSLALAKYGGIYFDLDVLFLRDLRPLCNVDFCYQWSDRPWANTAVAHARRGSSNFSELLLRGRKIQSLHPARLLDFAATKDSFDDLYVFPSFLFDPLWITNDRNKRCKRNHTVFDDFFTHKTAVTLVDFCHASYAYHWHNRWERTIQPGTIIGQLCEEIEHKYETLFRNSRHNGAIETQQLNESSLIEMRPAQSALGTDRDIPVE